MLCHPGTLPGGRAVGLPCLRVESGSGCSLLITCCSGSGRSDRTDTEHPGGAQHTCSDSTVVATAPMHTYTGTHGCARWCTENEGSYMYGKDQAGVVLDFGTVVTHPLRSCMRTPAASRSPFQSLKLKAKVCTWPWPSTYRTVWKNACKPVGL